MPPRAASSGMGSCPVARPGPTGRACRAGGPAGAAGQPGRGAHGSTVTGPPETPSSRVHGPAALSQMSAPRPIERIELYDGRASERANVTPIGVAGLPGQPPPARKRPETIRPRNSSTDWSRRSMTSENNWFGEVLAARTAGNAGPDVPYGQLSASENRGPGSSASPLELISGPIVPGPPDERPHRAPMDPCGLKVAAAEAAGDRGPTLSTDSATRMRRGRTRTGPLRRCCCWRDRRAPLPSSACPGRPRGHRPGAGARPPPPGYTAVGLRGWLCRSDWPQMERRASGRFQWSAIPPSE